MVHYKCNKIVHHCWGFFWQLPTLFTIAFSLHKEILAHSRNSFILLQFLDWKKLNYSIESRSGSDRGTHRRSLAFKGPLLNWILNAAIPSHWTVCCIIVKFWRMGAEFLHIWGSSPFASRIGCQNSLNRVFLRFDGFREYLFSKTPRFSKILMTLWQIAWLETKLTFQFSFILDVFKICE